MSDPGGAALEHSRVSPRAPGRWPLERADNSNRVEELRELYTFEEYAALVAAAERLDLRILAAVLLGGDAGLRAGEVMGLNQTDVSRANGNITIERQVWRGVVGTPKSGRGRTVPMTTQLARAIGVVRHLRGERVLLQNDGSPLSAKVLRAWIESVQRGAGLEVTGNFHVLRHTFCSHLAMRGAPAKVIQERAGHAPLDDDALQAPRERSQGAGDQVARRAVRERGRRDARAVPWRRRGGGVGVNEKRPGGPGR